MAPVHLCLTMVSPLAYSTKSGRDGSKHLLLWCQPPQASLYPIAVFYGLNVCHLHSDILNGQFMTRKHIILPILLHTE